MNGNGVHSPEDAVSGETQQQIQQRLDSHADIIKRKVQDLDVYRRELLAAKRALERVSSRSPKAATSPTGGVYDPTGELSRRLQALETAAEVCSSGDGPAGPARSGSRAPDRDGEKDVQIMQLQRALSTNEQARRLAAKREQELLDSMEEIAARHEELKEQHRQLRQQVSEAGGASTAEIDAVRQMAWARERELMDVLSAIQLGKLPVKDIPESMYEPRFTAVDGAYLPPTKQGKGDAVEEAVQNAVSRGVSRWAYFVMIVLAVGLVATGLALFSALLHTNRLQDQLATATSELEMVKSFRMLDRASATIILRQRLTDDLRSAAHSVARGVPLKRHKLRPIAEECDARIEGDCGVDDASSVLLDNGHFSEGMCEVLCPNVNCMHSRHWHRWHDHHEAVPQSDKLSIKTRVLFMAIAVVLLLGPYGFIRFAQRMPAGNGDVLLIDQINYRRAEVPAHTFRIDNWFSENHHSKPLALLILSGLLIAFGTAALLAASGGSLYEELWAAVEGIGIDWTFGGVDERTWLERVVAVFISIGGMLVTALMLGIVSDAIGEKMDDLRKGNSDVLETGHTLILGWNDKLLPIIKQIALANVSSGGGTIVVLADRDKEEMDMEVRRFLDQELPADSVPPESRTSVICRKGSCILMKDLKTVSVRTARSIIVLTESDDADAADAQALRIVLSLAGLREKDQMLGHVVVEVSDLNNEPLVALLGGENVETVVSEDVIGRLMLQCARQPGLAFVYDDLLGFEGCEFYVKKWPELVGRKFGDVVRMFADAVPCGVYSPRSDGGGRMLLNPLDSFVIEEGDEVVVIAEDEDSYAPLAGPVFVSANTPPRRTLEKHAEKVIFFGWRRDMADLIRHLEELVREGSELWLFNEVPLDEREEIFERAGLGAKDLKRLSVKHFVGDPVSRKDLSALPLERFTSALILSGLVPDGQTVASMDSKTLATLLLVRDIQTTRMGRAVPISVRRANWMAEMRKHAARRCEIVSEILDIRTKNLFAETQCCDYVLSNELMSKTLAMVSEDRLVNLVLKELFSTQGNDIFIRKSADYVFTGEELSFFEVQTRCRHRGEILLGVRSGDGSRPLLNPPDKSVRRRWEPGDSLVVLGKETGGK